MRKRTKALAIPETVNRAVWDRDGGCCIICGRQGAPNAHYISRAQGGLGIEENIVTLCAECHEAYDQTIQRRNYRGLIRAYLEDCYPDWNEDNLIYKK